MNVADIPVDAAHAHVVQNLLLPYFIGALLDAVRPTGLPDALVGVESVCVRMQRGTQDQHVQSLVLDRCVFVWIPWWDVDHVLRATPRHR